MSLTPLVRLLLPLWSLVLMGCPAHSGRFGAEDPLSAVRTAPSGFAIKGRMYLNIKAPRWDISGTTSTATISCNIVPAHHGNEGGIRCCYHIICGIFHSGTKGYVHSL